jgi:hypothetical protein
VGLSFDLGGTTVYGWVGVGSHSISVPGDVFTIKAFAHDDSGVAFAAGQTVSAVAEPSSVVLCGLAAVGVVSWQVRARRRNRS